MYTSMVVFLHMYHQMLIAIVTSSGVLRTCKVQGQHFKLHKYLFNIENLRKLIEWQEILWIVIQDSQEVLLIKVLATPSV